MSTGKSTLRFPASWEDLNMGADQSVCLVRDDAEGFFLWRVPWVKHLLSLVPSACDAGIITISFLRDRKKKKKKVLYFFQGAFLTSLCSLEKNLSHKVPLDKCIQAYEDLFKDSSDPRRFHRGCSDSQQGGRRASLCLSSWRLKSHERLMFKVACVASRRRPAGRA